MDGAVFAARIVLGGVFVAAGLLKVRDPAWPAAAREFGAPSWTVPALPWIEIAIGALVGAQLRWAAGAALALLLAFTVLMARHLARGERVPCGCFGAASAKPVDAAALARNGVLCVLAVLALL